MVNLEAQRFAEAARTPLERELEFMRSALASVSSGAGKWQKKWEIDTAALRDECTRLQVRCAELEGRLESMANVLLPDDSLLKAFLEDAGLPAGLVDSIARAAEMDKVASMQGLLSRVEQLKLKYPEVAQEFGLIG